MIRILFLDDDQARHDAVGKQLPAGRYCIDHVRSTEHSKQMLDLYTYDLVMLDHDLGEYGPPDMYGYREEYTGQHVARYIAKMPADRRPKKILIHSWNPDGAKAMRKILRDAGVTYVTLKPFEFSHE